jgi:tetratricopeptide (TPR) repeat protein
VCSSDLGSAQAKAQAAAQAARAAEVTALLAKARAGARSREPFLAQRYAFQLVRLLFYQRRWSEVIEAFDKHVTLLAAPSVDLSWRARYYAAGALLRSGQRARGNLELARIHAGYAPLAGVAANDFRPMEESDWRESLRLARSTKEKTELWRLVGITRDGVVAMQEIAKLEPASPLLALLMVREVEREEGGTAESWQGLPDASASPAKRRAMSALERLATQLAAAPATDRRWLMALVAGHLAAWRGDLAAAKRALGAALAARPDDARVRNQVHASLAMALVRDTAVSQGAPARAPAAARAEEIVKELGQVSPEFGRQARLTGEVRGTLAYAYAAAGQLIEAEMLVPGTLERAPATASKWHDAGFLKAMIARAAQAGGSTSPFERFLREAAPSKEQLELELAMLYVNQGAFAPAAKLLGGGGSKLGTDPFQMRVVDCHDCDHELYATAPWTHAKVVARMAELERLAGGKGEPAAAAALELGNALYNLTWFGNARVVLADTHQTVQAPRQAERWYRRAYELSRNRELRVKAAFFAAKAELATMITAAGEATGAGEAVWLEELPVPARWFPAVESFADTAYYQEVIGECSHFAAWTRRAH